MSRARYTCVTCVCMCLYDNIASSPPDVCAVGDILMGIACDIRCENLNDNVVFNKLNPKTKECVRSRLVFRDRKLLRMRRRIRI